MFSKSPSRPGESTTFENQSLALDFKSIDEAEILIQECDNFISQANQQMIVLPFGGLARIQKWRAKRRDDQLCGMYEVIQPRVQDTERILRNVIGEVVEKKRALRLQAKFLIARLDACMTYNCDLLSLSDTPVSDIRIIVNNLSSMSVAVKSMMVFNNEVLRQRNVQQSKQGKSFVPWTKRTAINKPLTEAELNADPDYAFLVNRLATLRESRGKFMDYLAHSLESRETFMSNLEGCATSKQMLQAVLQRDNVKEDNGSDVIPPFDHSKCSDCSYARTITAECVEHLSALQNQAITAGRRLQKLVEVREQIRDIAESLELANGIKLPEFNSIYSPSSTAAAASAAAASAAAGAGDSSAAPSSPPPPPASSSSSSSSSSASSSSSSSSTPTSPS